MKNIALDFGNTFTKAGIFDGYNLLKTEKFPGKSFDEVEKFIREEAAEKIIIASVVNIPDSFLEDFKEQVWYLSHISPLPIRIHYEDPSNLGKDRIASAVAGAYYFPGSSVLAIDCGSCITYDFISANGVFMGGGISPGLRMRLRSMADLTQQLPLIEINHLRQVDLIGNSTEDCMLSGAIHGLIKEVDGMIDAYKEEDGNLQVILGGGDAGFFENNLKNPIFAQPNLVLIGLNQILQFNA